MGQRRLSRRLAAGEQRLGPAGGAGLGHGVRDVCGRDGAGGAAEPRGEPAARRRRDASGAARTAISRLLLRHQLGGPVLRLFPSAHSLHTRRDRVVLLPPRRLYGAAVRRAPPLGPGRALSLPYGWDNAGFVLGQNISYSDSAAL